MKVQITVAVLFHLLVLQFGPATSEPTTKLPIQIYYESLCPDSVRFIQQQLSPSYKSLKDYVDILYVPFGKSASTTNKDKTVSFDCQHGPEECDGNRAQSCVLNHLAENAAAQTEFVACQMAPGADQTGFECGQKVGVAEEVISECFDGGLGTQLQLEAEILTKAISPSFVPTIVYNWKFNQRLQDRSMRNFKSIVCQQIDSAAPGC